MRVVEPKHFSQKPKKAHRKVSVKKFGISIVLVGAIFFAYTFFSANQKVTTQNEVAVATVKGETTNDNQEVAVANEGQKSLRQFSDNEFRLFYENLNQPNLTRVENSPTISGNDLADARMRKLAEDRGYRLRSSPTTDLQTVNGIALQPVVWPAWQKLRNDALANGLDLSIVSGYRSVENQRTLFLDRFAAAGGTITAAARGEADKIIDKILQTSSIPGYSKHHTGYTMDFQCAGTAFEDFKNSACNTWLSADNYKVAKEAGFIPSYPPTADSQGPDPEAWEYVYVGTDLLYQ